MINYIITVESDDPINAQFPDQFSIGNSNNEPGKLEMYFDDLLVKGIQKEWNRKVKKQKKMDKRRQRQNEDGTSEDHL